MLLHLVFISGVFSYAVYSFMHFRNRSASLTFIALLLTLLSATAVSQETSWQKENAAWREQHKADLLKPDGWLLWPVWNGSNPETIPPAPRPTAKSISLLDPHILPSFTWKARPSP